MNRYYTMQVSGESADIYIFGDIVSPREKDFFDIDSDVSGMSLVQDIKRAGKVKAFNVHINSYGGLVSEGWAIFNELKDHPAEVTTIVEGFACSAASLVFMAGDKRVMRDLSALWIHEVQSGVHGSADDKRKAADEDEAMTKVSAQAYLKHVNIPQAQLMDMMKQETWIFPEEAVQMGFATSIEAGEEVSVPTQSAREKVFSMCRKGNGPVAHIVDAAQAPIAHLQQIELRCEIICERLSKLEKAMTLSEEQCEANDMPEKLEPEQKKSTFFNFKEEM